MVSRMPLAPGYPRIAHPGDQAARMPAGQSNPSESRVPGLAWASLRSRRWHWRLSRIAVVLGGLVGTTRLTGWAESSVFYFPSRTEFANPAGCEDVWITTADGVRLHGWFLRAADAVPGEVRPAILHCHGNAGNVESHLGFSRFLTHSGFHVLIFDYRGYGRSDAAGRLRRSMLSGDALAAFDALAARPDVDPSRVGTYGVSLGGVFALHVASQRPSVAAACTVAAFSSWGGVAADHVPLIGSVLIPAGLDPVDMVPAIGSRAYLIVHGEADDIVPVRHAGVLEAAAEAARVSVRVARIPGGNHNGIVDRQDSRDAIAGFFRSALAPGAGTQAP